MIIKNVEEGTLPECRREYEIRAVQWKDKNDNFTITLDQSNRQHVNIITSMLKESNFYILEQGINNSGDYYISANKYK